MSAALAGPIMPTAGGHLRHVALRELLLDRPSVFRQLPPTSCRSLVTYYGLEGEHSAESLRELQRAVRSTDPSLPQRAGKAYAVVLRLLPWVHGPIGAGREDGPGNDDDLVVRPFASSSPSTRSWTGSDPGEAVVVRKIVLDCDPGHDDAIAMLLAHGSPEVELVAVTTVAGNQTLAKVTRNARAVAELAGITGIPIAAGADRPLVRRPEVASSIHGESGMDGPVLPEPTIPLDPRHAVDVIVDVVMSHDPGEITLVPTGALTNIALAVRKEPRIVERVREVVLMGGGLHVGNWSSVAEFNIVIDPEAAHIVFSAGWPVVMVGLDLTHQATATPDVVDRFRAIGTAQSRFVVELLEFFGSTYEAQQGFAAPPVHDPCAVAYVIDPSIMQTVKVPIGIELTGTLTLGMTVADFRRPAPDDCRTSAATVLDRGRFWDLVVRAVETTG